MTRVGSLERWLKNHRHTVELGTKLVMLLVGIAKLLGLLVAN
jgi:hypothetical protein